MEGPTHREKAEGRLSRAGDLMESTHGQDEYIPLALAEAQVHASLAIAEQLGRLNEKLAEVPHLMNQIAVGVQRV